MAKSFAEKMQQVAQNSRDMNKKYPPKTINTAPKVDTRGKSNVQPQVFGGSMNKAHPKDVNLSLSTAPKKSVAQQVVDAGEEVKKKKPEFKNFGLVKRP